MNGGYGIEWIEYDEHERDARVKKSAALEKKYSNILSIIIFRL